MINKIRLLLVLVILSGLCAGCAVKPAITEDTIVKIYARERDKPKECPLIFIPGIFGSVLEDSSNGKIIWGSVPKGLIDELALPIDSTNITENKDQVVPAKILTEFKVIPGLIEKDIYGKAREIAIKAAGYRANDTVFSLAYDWRRDLVEASKRLGDLIDEIKRKKNNPGLKFDIVCHSAGGLVARYYAKYGTEDVLSRDPLPEPSYEGAKNINRIIMLGTPNYGSLESFKSIDRGIRIPGVGNASNEIIFTIQSAYELMPPVEKISFIDYKGNDLNVSLYDPANWEKYGWSVFGKTSGSIADREKQRLFLAAMLKRAGAFQKALWKGSTAEEARHINYILLGSDAEPTLDKALLEKMQGGWKTRFEPHDDTLQDSAFQPGDTTVTRKSLLGTHIENGKEVEFPSSYEIFISQKHVDLPGTPTFLDNVLHSLLDKSPPRK